MTEHGTADQTTALDRFFNALRGIGIRRRTDDKWIAGVCSGLADRLGVDPVIVRAGLVVLTLLGGIGLTLYLIAWALLPNDRDEIAAQRALRDGDGGSIVLLIFATFSLFGGSWWGHDMGWGFPWGLVLTGALVWWLVQRSRHRPEADQRVSAQQGSPQGTQQGGMPFAGGSTPAQPSGEVRGTPFTAGPLPSPSATTYRPTPPTPRPVVPREPRRRSGGPLMALLAIGLALVTYGSLMWLGDRFSWTGDHQVIAMAGSLAAMGLLLVGLGLAGWRAGFVAFMTIVLGISVWGSAVVPSGIHVGGRVGEASWAPTSVAAVTNYNLGVGDGVLDLSGLPLDGLSQAKIPVYVGLGELRVVVPEGLTVQLNGKVGLGEILLPGETDEDGQGGTDVERSTTIGDGPTEVIVDAGVGVGQLTVVKE